MTIIPNTYPKEVIIQRIKGHKAAIKHFKSEKKILNAKLFNAHDDLIWHEKALAGEQEKMRKIAQRKLSHYKVKES